MDLEDESKLSESEDCGEPAENTMGDDSANTEEQGSQDEENSCEQDDSSSSQEETGSNDEDTLSHPSHGSKAIADEQGTRNQGGEMPYHCSKCDIRFADVAYLERHNKSVHNGGGQGFNCCVCNKEFKRNKNLKAHLKIHTSERPFGCSQCDKQFIDVHGLSKHEKTHDTRRSFNCCICGKQYKNSDGLKKHLNSHTRQNLYGCSVCNKQFTLKDSLQGHMKLHADEKQFTCPHCEKTFTKRDNMKRHMRVHTGEMPYSCTECNKLFRCTSNLYRHMKTHADVKPVAYNKSYEEIQPRDEAPSPVFTICRDLENPELFNCDQCNKKFSLDIDLIRHWQEVHSGNSKPYVCFECLRRFRYSRSLSIHLKRSHYKENPSAIRLDMKCLKTRPVESFSENRVKDEDGGSKSTGNYSVEIYDGEIPFSCQQCTKQFKDMPALNAHMSVHSEEKLFRYRPIGGRHDDEKEISSEGNREEVRSSAESFNCFVCNQRYNNKEHLKAHMIIHTGGKPFNCNECNQQFNDAQSLSKHKMTHAAPVVSKFSCHFCDKKCTDYEDLVEHLNFHITQTLSGQTVQNSGLAVQNKSGKPNSNSSGRNLSDHSTPSSNTRASSANQSGKINSSSDQSQSSCCICNKRFTLRSSLAMHMKIHTGEKQFSCSHCDRTFTKRDNMKRHMRVHTGEMPYSCTHCDKLFRCSSNLYRHLRSHSKDGSSQRSQSDGGEASSSADSKPVATTNNSKTKNKFSCDQCNKSFPREKDLKKHRKIHKGSFECQFCSRQFHDSQAYSRHVKRHGESESMISCGFCDRQFLRADSLKSHMKLHTGENLYGCTLCDRTFTVKGSLEMHMKIHSGEKSFGCSQCDKKFLRKNSLNQHMRTHTGEMPYCCSLCKMRFRHSSHLHRHIKKKHSEGELAKFSQNNEPIQSVDELKTAFALIAMSYNEENLNICDEEFLHGGTGNSRGYVKKPYVCFECRRCYAESENLVEHVNKNHFCDARYDIVATSDKDPETGYELNPAADRNLESNSESDVGSQAMSGDESDPKLSEKRKKLEKKMPSRSDEHSNSISREKLENGVEEKEKENCDCIFCTKPFQES